MAFPPCLRSGDGAAASAACEGAPPPPAAAPVAGRRPVEVAA
ncbi:hypothetical protein SCE1572_02525 [Sorangium cellulosum So0157-2]|uniref:Uncharacterized protein n=1 Tax=Sorangium cellulosum So0157-2 TaxID=1254432 RepID=S4XSC7_SORCE|nr:hypothetical protein SCE1572_02525 [Sorangium cellulosum So0157-2]